MTSRLTSSMFSSGDMLNVFSDQAIVQRMLDVEAALARAEAQHGVIPATAVRAICGCCDAALIDLSALMKAAGPAGNLAIPLVKQLTALVAAHDAEAAKYVHWGATSQDIIDTGLVLQLREAFRLFDADLDRLAGVLAHLAEQHRHTPMVGRTWMQHALPITFGLKAAGWLDAIVRHMDRLDGLRVRSLVLQFGGAAGTLASLGGKGLQVAATLAEELGLTLPDMPWHTQRDRVVEAATVIGMLTGTLGKMARDISLQMQTDVAEVSEPLAEGRGGSSTMPHKRNPVGCAAALTAAMRVPALVSTMLSAMVQEHERALGGWQAEWDTLPKIMQLASGALEQIRSVVSGLAVDAARMRINLDATQGQIMAEAVALALGGRIGRMQAHQAVERACYLAAGSGRHLGDVLKADPAIRAELQEVDIDKLLDPAGYTGEAEAFIERVLHTYRERDANKH
ncbi:3-carboxy-cis,cis-muconate cycloisomerase [Noviherbaspirillum sp.]|uniref:3-carboxy-cis,cis-muconate cycloisomerase n=1 Tax=Noviherbaspirillum sp. TaxID=1926288 RepID=UPI002B474D59|nr:3-carboxy-cis,cis-muconate cycloisomerase [Noviherbaspirillum sp.]HJV81775.1 3-carboxy-cis,cis-muconate cycloisomerase [Noviherbaspirillum sp.]